MITTLGKIITLNNLATGERALSTHVAVGAMPTVATVSDKQMSAEWARADVRFIVADPINNRLLIKAVLPAGLEGKIYEIGSYVVTTGLVDKVISTFDQNTEAWTGTFTTANTRVGGSSLSLTAAASTTASSTISDVSIDIGTGALNDDTFRLALNVSSANCNYVEFIMKTDASNFATARFNTPPAGYSVRTLARSALTVTGTPNYANISEITVNLNSTAGGSTTVDLDLLRVEGAHDNVSGTILVARQEIVSPIIKKRGVELEIETTLGVFA